MSKTKIAIFVAIILILTVGGFLLLLRSRSSSQNQPIITLPFTQPKQAGKPILDTSYTDQSGFSFKYPSKMKVSDITPSDDTYYTLLTIGENQDNAIKITVRDDPNYQPPAGSSLVGATTLATLPAKQYSYKVDAKDVLSTVLVDRGVLYLIQGPKDGGYWEDLQNDLISSFLFSGQEASQDSGNAAAQENVINEGDEVIE